jgi:hypothetical protein
MIPGNTVQDTNPACRPEPDDASGSGAAAGYAGAEHSSADYGASPTSGKHPRSPRIHRPLQDIQDIIDKLAAVTQELRSR